MKIRAKVGETMVKEIGGDFWRGIFTGVVRKLHHNSCYVRFVMSGRTGIHLIMRDIIYSKKSLRKVLLPSYCSHSMLKPIFDIGIEIAFFNVRCTTDGLNFDYDYDHDCECLLLMDYFGFCSAQLPIIAKEERKRGRIVIIDSTQSVYCNCDYDLISDYTITSYRKWFASSLARVYCKSGFNIPEDQNIFYRYEKMRQLAFSLKNDDINGNMNFQYDYKSVFEESENMLRRDYQFYSASMEEIMFWKSNDIRHLQEARRRNATVLTDLINSLSSQKLRTIYKSVGINDCPLYVPIIVDCNKTKNNLMKILSDNSIICYIHWRFSDLHDQQDSNNELYTSELSLVCDQRYDKKDMFREYEVISDFLKKT